MVIPRGVLPVLISDRTVRLELEELNEISMDVAKRELRETPESKLAAIEELRNLLKGKF